MKLLCPDCKRGSRFEYKKRVKMYWCGFCGKYYDKGVEHENRDSIKGTH